MCCSIFVFKSCQCGKKKTNKKTKQRTRTCYAAAMALTTKCVQVIFPQSVILSRAQSWHQDHLEEKRIRGGTSNDGMMANTYLNN